MKTYACYTRCDHCGIYDRDPHWCDLCGRPKQGKNKAAGAPPAARSSAPAEPRPGSPSRPAAM